MPRCYKIITQDKNDEIVDIQASLMMGVAVQVSKLQQARTNWQGTLGILTTAECQTLITSVNFVQNLEYNLFQYLKKVHWSEF